MIQITMVNYQILHDQPEQTHPLVIQELFFYLQSVIVLCISKLVQIIMEQIFFSAGRELILYKSLIKLFVITDFHLLILIREQGEEIKSNYFKLILLCPIDIAYLKMIDIVILQLNGLN